MGHNKNNSVMSHGLTPSIRQRSEKVARKGVPVNTRNSTAHLQPAANSIYRCMKCSHLVLMLAIGAGCFETPLQMATAIAEAFPLLFVVNPSASRILALAGAKCYGAQLAIGCMDDVDSSMRLCLGRQAKCPNGCFRLAKRRLVPRKARVSFGFS